MPKELLLKHKWEILTTWECRDVNSTPYMWTTLRWLERHTYIWDRVEISSKKSNETILFRRRRNSALQTWTISGRFFGGEKQDSKSTSGGVFCVLGPQNMFHKHLFGFHGCARSKHSCLTAVPSQKWSLWTQVSQWKVFQPCNYGIKKLEKPHVPKRQASSYSLILMIVFAVMRLITFQAAVQRAPFQPDFTFSRTNEAVIRTVIKNIAVPIWDS